MKETRFKQTEIGLIPEDWKVVPIEELFEIGNGYTPSKAIPEYWNHGTLPWFRMEDIRLNGRILKDSIQHITPLAVKGSGLFPANSIIISTTATIGEHALLIADSLANQQFTFLWNVNRCYSVDMYYVFYHCFLLGKWCRNNINFGGLTAVNMNAFKKYPFPLPPISEQRKIAESLGDMDALIAELDKLIAKKRLIKQGTMQQLLTGRTRLKGFNEPWKKEMLGSLCTIWGRIGFRGYTREDLVSKGNGAITFSPSDINNDKLYLDDCDYISFQKYEESPEIKVYNGDIILCKTASIGKCAIVENLFEKATINPQFVVLKDFQCNNRFLYYILIFTPFQIEIKNIAGGSTIPTVSQEKMKLLTLSIPKDVGEQCAIASVLTDMDKEISELEKKKAKYEKLKQGMMQQLLSGRIRLI